MLGASGPDKDGESAALNLSTPGKEQTVQSCDEWAYISVTFVVPTTQRAADLCHPAPSSRELRYARCESDSSGPRASPVSYGRSADVVNDDKLSDSFSESARTLLPDFPFTDRIIEWT